jgi:hypothetical protein
MVKFVVLLEGHVSKLLSGSEDVRFHSTAEMLYNAVSAPAHILSHTLTLMPIRRCQGSNVQQFPKSIGYALLRQPISPMMRLWNS